MEFNKPPEWGRRFTFPENIQIEYNGLTGSVTTEIAVKMAERYEDAVVKQIAMEAKLAGVADCTVLNKAAILEALQKQIPQKVIIAEDEALCPACRYDMMGLWDFPDVQDPNYCPICGQALDWGDA